MGMTRAVSFPHGPPPEWEAVRARLASINTVPELRMIDGLPAYPDESLGHDWQEVRVSFGGSMVTLRRTKVGFECVAWGNADGPAVAGWNSLAWACASAGGGLVSTPSGSLSPDDFARSVGIAAS